MDFKFEEVIPQTICDNYGCPCLTEFTMNFSVDGTNWQARFSDVWQGIELYSVSRTIKHIKHIKHRNRFDWTDYSTVRSAIENAFLNDEDIKKVFHKVKGDEIEFAKNELCEKLLKSDSWS